VAQIGETKKRGPLKNLFTDTFAEMPWHLKEQHAMLENHVREYSDEYDLSRYTGALDPA